MVNGVPLNLQVPLARAPPGFFRTREGQLIRVQRIGVSRAGVPGTRPIFPGDSGFREQAVPRVMPTRTFRDSGAVFDPNTNELIFPDGTRTITTTPEIANRQFVVQRQQEQTLAAERGRITGLIPAGVTPEQRRQKAAQLSIGVLGRVRPPVTTAAILAKQAVEMEEEPSVISKEQAAREKLRERVSTGLETIQEKFIPGVPLGISLGGIRAGITSFVTGTGRKAILQKGLFESRAEFARRTAQEVPEAVAKVAKEVGKAVQPRERVTAFGVAKRVGVGVGLAGVGAAAPDITRQLAIAGTPELAGVDTDTPLIREARRKAFEKANKAFLKEEKELLTVGGAVRATQTLFPPLKGATSEIFRDTFKKEFSKVVGTVLTKTQVEKLVEADLAAQVFGGTAGIAFTEIGAEITGRAIAPAVFRATGTRTALRRFAGGFFTAAPAGVLEATAATQAFAAAEAQPVKPLDFLKAGLFGAGTAGAFTGVAAVIAPIKGGPIAGRAFELVDVPGEQLGNIGANLFTRIGLSLPEPRITRSQTGLVTTLFGRPTKPTRITPAPARPVPTVKVPVAVPSRVPRAVITPTPTPTIITEVVRPVPTPAQPIGVPTPLISPIQVPEPTETAVLPVDVRVPTPISLTVPIPVVSATGLPILPIFGFGVGETKAGRRQRTELFDELTLALNSIFGRGFVQTIQKRSVPPKKRRKRKRKTTKPLRFI